MRVLCLVPYPTLGASNRLRVEQYAPLLRREGIELTISPFLDEAAYRILYSSGHVASKVLAVGRGVARRAYDLARSPGFDLALIHRESAPIGPPIVERALRTWGKAFVYDFDDAVFIRAVHPSNRAWGWLRRTDPAETARLAQSVIAGNGYLAEWARRHNTDVTVLSTPVDTERHRPPAHRAAGGPIVIGWVGSSTTAPFLRILDRVFAAVASRHDILVRVIGGDYSHDRVRVECLPYSLMDEPRQVATFDIGVLPEPDDPWTRGKGGFKALVYMATGVPVLASRVGVNEDVVGDGGYCVATEEEWIAAIERLIASPELRHEIGAAGRERVLARNSLSIQAPRFAAILRRAAK